MKMSLKWKFIIAFTMIPLLSLGTFFFLVYKNFKQDRLASIYETSLTQSRLLSKFTAERIAPVTTFMEYWAEFYFRDPNYSTTIVRLMREKTNPLKNLSSAILIDYNPLELKVLNTQQLIWSPEPIKAEAFISQIESYRPRLTKYSTKPIILPHLHSQDWVLAQRFKKDNNREIYVLTAMNPRWTQTRFPGQVVTSSYWFNDEGDVIGQTSSIDKNLTLQILRSIAAGRSTLGAFELSYNNTKYIAAYNSPQQAQLIMVNLLKADIAKEALSATFEQSFLLLVIIIFLSLIVGILLSKKLTEALQILLRATNTISRGVFNLQIHIKSGDEIEALGTAVMDMGKKIEVLVNETKELGRMESELLLGKEVQATLFPPESFDSYELSIRGFSKPASEVGGDWWGFYETTDYFFIFVGDATGHGVPAALLTTAIHSIVGTLLNLKIQDPKTMLSEMNRSLFQTAQGKKTMTLALLKINRATGLINYGIAGHEPPLILRDLTAETKLNELISMDITKAPPLGLKPDAEFTEATFQLQPQDSILLYTDGAPDARDRDLKPWGERRFTKTVTDSLSTSYDLDGAIDNLKKSFEKQTKGQALVDDVTIVLVQFHGVDEKKVAQ